MIKNPILTIYFSRVLALFPMRAGLPSAGAFVDSAGNRKTGMIIAAFEFI
jgi:hypothetical protein